LALTAPAFAQRNVTYYGAGCNQGGLFQPPAIDVFGSPVEGQQMSIGLRGVPAPGTATLLIGGNRGSLPLDPIGFPGCTLLVAPVGLTALSLPMPFTGLIELPVAGWPAGIALDFQVAYSSGLFPTRLGFSNGVELRPIAAPPNPTVYAFAPSGGGVGTRLQVHGATFRPGRYAPGDYLVMGQGVHGFLARATRVTDTGLDVTTTYHTPFPKPTPITVVPGRRRTVQLPTMSGRPAFPPAHTFRSDGTPRTTSSQRFDPRRNGGADMPTHKTSVDVHLTLDVTNNKLTLKWPDPLCTGDKWKYDLVLYDWTTGEVFNFSFDTSASGSGWVNGLPAGGAVGQSILAFQLKSHIESELDSNNLPIFRCTPTADGLCIEFNPDNPLRATDVLEFDLASNWHLDFGAGYSTHTVLAGVPDGFVTGNGVELTYPDPVWRTNWFTRNPAQGQRHYDENTIDETFLDTLAIPGTGSIRSVIVEVRLRGAQSRLTSTDSIALGWNGTTATIGPWAEWGAGMVRLEQLGFNWVPGQDYTFEWDLSELPLVDANNITTGYAKILHTVSDNDLDVLVQDDTDVDYVRLWVVRC
jgi:hypothetical protein